MIQDIEPYVYNNAYDPKAPDKDSFVLYCHDMEVLVKYEGKEIAFPTFGELEKFNPDIYEQYTYLFSIDQMRFYLTEHLTYDAAGNFQMIHKEQFRHAKPRHLAFAGITGFQLYNWYKSRKYCGKCGNPLKKDQKERMLYCENCHQRE